MRFSTAIVFLGSAAFAAAATTTASAASSQSTCQAEYILQACLGSENAKVASCVGNDWVCLCQNYQNVLTCYNNCPNDPLKATVQNQVTSYCGAAAPILSASSASAASAGHTAAASSSGSAATAESTLATATTTGTSKATGSSSATGSKSTATGAASGMVAPLGGAMAIALGLIGML